VSLAVFALVVVIWVVLLVPLARRGRAELAAEAAEGNLRLSRGARPWTTGNLPAHPDGDDLEAAAAGARLVLVAATVAGLRAWAVLGGRWWAAGAAAGLLLAGYLLTLAGLGWRRSRRRRALAVGARAARDIRWTSRARSGPWGGPVAPSTE
jgi:hypothetical protein